ncbi:hypothetical protein [Candidatus Hecatella orcuttiae]|nr:hypothetical protein [Candidatus Hecatella orcuttiae]
MSRRSSQLSSLVSGFSAKPFAATALSRRWVFSVFIVSARLDAS